MLLKVMSRLVPGVDPNDPDKYFNFADCSLTTRLSPSFDPIKPTIKSGIRGSLCYYEGTTLGDMFVTDLFRFYPGTYDMTIYGLTTPLSCEITLTLDGNIIGVVDFYSPLTQETTLLVEGISVTQFLQRPVRFEVTRKSASSLGYNLILGDMRIVKRQ